MTAYRLVLLLILVALIAVVLILALRSPRGRPASGSQTHYQFFGPGIRDDDRYWLAGGFIYDNPEDPSLFVVNRWGIGITVNVAHRLATWAAIAFLLMLALVPILLILLSGGPGAAGSGCHSLSGCH